MCRFICYSGSPIMLADLLYRPGHSLILQSYQSMERREPLNGDGFGIGWYQPEISDMPCVFTSLTPAWSNRNLQRLSDHVKSPCFFAHVRAASPGMQVADANCHPFQFGRYLWMHNGTVEGFTRIKRRVQQSLPDDLFQVIQGTTDSEHAFAVFLNLLGNSERIAPANELGQLLVRTVENLEQWVFEADVDGPSYYNFAVTDGQSIAAIRYVSDQRLEPASLYYVKSRKFSYSGGASSLIEANEDPAVIIASERLTEQKDDWVRVAPNHVLTVTAGLEVEVELVGVQRRSHEP